MTRPIVGLSAKSTAEVLGRVRAAIADGATELSVLADQLDLDQGVIVAALKRMQEDGELTTDQATRTFSLKEGR